MTQEKQSRERPRGIHLLPNLFTTAGLFAGFFAIVSAMKGYFEQAAIAIFIAMIADALDGRVARLTHTQTAFGAEYDSLSDMVSFGVAPALVVYTWALSGLGKLGWLAAFIFAAAVALRLARFNTQIKTVDKRFFQGLACPSGAAIIASMVWLGDSVKELNLAVEIIIAVITVIVAALMVSNIRYRSFKDVDVRGRIPFVTLLVIVLIFAGIALDPPTVLFIIFAGYGLSGPIHTLYRLQRARHERRVKKKKIKQEK